MRHQRLDPSHRYQRICRPQPAAKTTAKADKPKHTRSSTERRIISELHHHGIYW
ncbi:MULTISPECIES: hypothetical protein [Bradyrhizobium]|uniref:hypothetical protein n=1 Tax=Bradyrhizobium TaxID=374 RepID=UPI001BA7F1EE|nr:MULTISPECIES: hypothetical protein [Bradyrhizobium]MBR0711333.1 hypothetical protein [Bradyrhizobium liaoningense]